MVAFSPLKVISLFTILAEARVAFSNIKGDGCVDLLCQNADLPPNSAAIPIPTSGRIQDVYSNIPYPVDTLTSIVKARKTKRQFGDGGVSTDDPFSSDGSSSDDNGDGFSDDGDDGDDSGDNGDDGDDPFSDDGSGDDSDDGDDPSNGDDSSGGSDDDPFGGSDSDPSDDGGSTGTDSDSGDTGTDNNPFDSDTGSNNDPFGSEDGFPFDNVAQINSNTTKKIIGIALGVTGGIFLLLYGIVFVVFLVRQKQRKAWYGSIASFYRNGGDVQSVQPLLSTPVPQPMSSPVPSTLNGPINPRETPMSEHSQLPYQTYNSGVEYHATPNTSQQPLYNPYDP